MNFGFRGRIADLVRQDPAASSKNRKSCFDRKRFCFIITINMNPKYSISFKYLINVYHFYYFKLKTDIPPWKNNEDELFIIKCEIIAG